MKALCRLGGVVILLLVALPAYAQQTIFNVPSAEITEKNEIYLQHQSNFRPWKPGPYYQTNQNAAYGLGHNTELDLTLFNVEAPTTDNLAIGVGFRSVIPLLSRKLPKPELKLTVGDMLPVSLNGGGAGNWGYSHLSAKVPKLNTRVIAGVSAGTADIFGRDTVHFMGAVEQPLTRGEKLKLIADWMSGTHDYAFLTPGLEYEVNPHLTVQAGYQIPNSPGSGRSGFTVQLETTF